MGRPAYRILIADRNPNVREFLRRSFEAAGFIVTLAKDGWELFSLIRKRSAPDLIVLDPEIPNRYGAGLLERLDAELLGLPVVLHRLHGPDDRLPGEMAEAAADVEKNGDVDALLATVRDVLHRHYVQAGH